MRRAVTKARIRTFDTDPGKAPLAGTGMHGTGEPKT